MIRVALIVGTRPEVIKMAPIALRLSQAQGMQPILVLTAQHRTMCDDVLEVFNLVPDYDLNIMRPNQSLFEVTSRLARRLEGVLRDERPDIVLVQGDTTSTLMGSLCAYYLQVPVGHVEAGLRTYNKYSPFPEEINRRMVSAIADLHFAPTKVARKALVDEGINRRSIFVVGNPVVDALLHVSAQEYPFRDRRLASIDFEAVRVMVVTAHRRESHGRPFVSMLRAIKKIVASHRDVIVVFPVHPNPNVRRPVMKMLADTERIVLVDPLDYGQFVKLLKSCYLILTDSGGIQEEAPSLGKPVLLMRNVTERPEAVEAGVVRVVGTDTDRIFKACSCLLESQSAYRSMVTRRNPYGDGKASDRIVRIIRRYFAKGD